MTEDFRREALAIIRADTQAACCRSLAEAYAAARASLSSVYPRPQRVEIAADGRMKGCVRIRVCGPEIVGEFSVGLRPDAA